MPAKSCAIPWELINAASLAVAIRRIPFNLIERCDQIQIASLGAVKAFNSNFRPDRASLLTFMVSCSIRELDRELRKIRTLKRGFRQKQEEFHSFSAVTDRFSWNPVETAMRSELFEILFSSLTVNESVLFKLRFFEGLTNPQIEKKMQLSNQSIQAKISGILKFMRIVFSENIAPEL